MYKLAKIMEKLWLILAIFATCYAIYMVYTEGYEASKTYILVALVTFLWYFVRNNLRRRIESSIKKQEGE